MVSVVICTYKRPGVVHILLKSIENQSKLPENIIIVGTSEIDFNTDTNNQIIKLRNKGIKVEKFCAPKGLTKQRNFGVNQLPTDTTIVCFLDDDILIPKNYFESVSNNFRDLPDAIGIGFVTHDNLNRKNRISIWDSISMNNSFRPGKLLKSGINSGFDYQSKPYLVDWLPGCSMSYKYNIFQNVNFDERRSDVGWGEDVDFSFRTKEFGNLYMVSISDLVHTRSKVNRDGVQRIIELDYLSKVYFALDKIGPVKFSWIIFSIFFNFKFKLFRFNFKFKLFRFNFKFKLFRFIDFISRVRSKTKGRENMDIIKILTLCIQIYNGIFRKFNSDIFNLMTHIKTRLTLIMYVYRIKKELSEKYE